jgi:hypothetical protein
MHGQFAGIWVVTDSASPQSKQPLSHGLALNSAIIKQAISEYSDC